MGCICCKPSAIEDSKKSPRERLSSKPPSESGRASRGEDRRNEGTNDEKVMLIDKQKQQGNVNANVNGAVRLNRGGESLDRRKEKAGEFVVTHRPYPAVGSIPKPVEGEQVAAGRPTWLAAVAGEAIKGWWVDGGGVWVVRLGGSVVVACGAVVASVVVAGQRREEREGERSEGRREGRKREGSLGSLVN